MCTHFASFFFFTRTAQRTALDTPYNFRSSDFFNFLSFQKLLLAPALMDEAAPVPVHVELDDEGLPKSIADLKGLATLVSQYLHANPAEVTPDRLAKAWRVNETVKRVNKTAEHKEYTRKAKKRMLDLRVKNFERKLLEEQEKDGRRPEVIRTRERLRSRVTKMLTAEGELVEERPKEMVVQKKTEVEQASHQPRSLMDMLQERELHRERVAQFYAEEEGNDAKKAERDLCRWLLENTPSHAKQQAKPKQAVVKETAQKETRKQQEQQLYMRRTLEERTESDAKQQAALKQKLAEKRTHAQETDQHRAQLLLTPEQEEFRRQVVDLRTRALQAKIPKRKDAQGTSAQLSRRQRDLQKRLANFGFDQNDLYGLPQLKIISGECIVLWKGF